MSGMEPFLLAASAGLGAISTVSGMAQARQQEKYQKQAAAIQAQQAQAQIADLEEDRQKANRERLERLERAQATQRAAYAASGVSGDGSGDAVFDNLLAQSEQERADIDDQINRRISSLQSGIQLNLLSRPSSSNLLGGLASVAGNLGRMSGYIDQINAPKQASLPKTGGTAP